MAIPDPHALTALINLLDEPDDVAYDKVKATLLEAGERAIAPLGKALENTFDPLVQGRITEIIGTLRRQNLRNEFSQWVNLGSSDLLQGYMLVTRTQYPDLDPVEINSRIEQLRMDIWLELNENLTALENIKVVNHILFRVHQYEGSKSDLTAPEGFYLNTMLEQRKGSAVALGMLYIILCRKLGLPVYGVNLPYHFILAYLTDPGLSIPTEDDVLFYINPFNKGTVFTRREIELFVRQMKLTSERDFFAPCTNQDIVKRLIRNLVNIYTHYGYPDKIEDLDNLLTTLE